MGSAVRSVGNRPRNAVRERTKNHVNHNVHIMNGRNAIGRIIPPVAIFKGKAYLSEFAESFPSGSSL
jgi:hypothetical protein